LKEEPQKVRIRKETGSEYREYRKDMFSFGAWTVDEITERAGAFE
jgi:hypothetical protein